MKWISRISLVLFALLLLLPLARFNFQPDVVSEIDNRRLADNPFSAESRESGEDFSKSIENYVSDRIGYRDEMILAYTVANDKLFHKMVHPSYMYGKDGYVFFDGITKIEYSEFHEEFADLVLDIQNYCQARGVPFLFAFEPSKIAALSEYLPEGYNYDRTWVDQFLNALDERGVHYIDNTPLLREKHEAGETVFNVKYDAGHWNNLGAFYGVNHIFEELHKDVPTIVPNSLEDFTITETLEESLPVSTFPISEMVPEFQGKAEVERVTEEYSKEVARVQKHPHFDYIRNPQKLAAGAPKTLVFQGSYMNGKGAKFLANGLGEYIAVHNYQNVLNFPYYFQLFQPECVIFEVTEYTMNEGYFDLEKMKSLAWNEPLAQKAEALAAAADAYCDASSIVVEQGEHFTNITWAASESYDHIWLVTGEKEFDMWQVEGGYATSLPNEYLTDLYNAQIIVETDGVMTVYHPQ